jgi:hypothetical protein
MWRRTMNFLPNPDRKYHSARVYSWNTVASIILVIDFTFACSVARNWVCFDVYTEAGIAPYQPHTSPIHTAV